MKNIKQHWVVDCVCWTRIKQDQCSHHHGRSHEWRHSWLRLLQPLCCVVGIMQTDLTDTVCDVRREQWTASQQLKNFEAKLKSVDFSCIWFIHNVLHVNIYLHLHLHLCFKYEFTFLYHPASSVDYFSRGKTRSDICVWKISWLQEL